MKENKDVVETIRIYISNQASERISKLAVLWYSADNGDANLISPKLVSEVLRLETQPDEKARTSPKIPFQGTLLDIRGYVDLEWGFRKSRNTRMARFAVVSQYDPPFDVLLGRETAIQCGLAN